MLLDQHLSNYESIDNIETQVESEIISLQVDRPSLSEHQDKSTDFNNAAQRSAEKQSPSAHQHTIPSQGSACYATLGDRSTPPPVVYEGLHDQEPAAQEGSKQTDEYTSHKTSLTAKEVGIYQNLDHGLYVNVNQISLVGKVREQ